jgi:acyl carrier protein
VRERTKRIVASVLRLDPAVIADDARSEDVAGWDSLAQIEIMLALERELGVRIPAEAMLELTSLPAIAEFVDGAAA